MPTFVLRGIGRQPHEPRCSRRRLGAWIRMHRPHGVRRARLLFFFCAVALLAHVPSITNGAPRLHLKGRAKIEAHAARYSGETALVGRVTDDMDVPSPLRVSMTLSRAQEETGHPYPPDPRATTTGPSVLLGRSEVSLATAAPESCGPGRRSLLLESATRILLPTDPEGRFCVRLLVPTERYVAHLVSEPSPLLDGASVDLPFDVAARPVDLRFGGGGGGRLDLSLDGPAPIVEVVAASDVDGAEVPMTGLTLHLSDEHDVAVADDATTDGAGHARFTVDVSRLGPPGPGQIHVRFDGTAREGAAATTASMERTARVSIQVPDALGGTLPAAWPEDGVTIAVRASFRTGAAATTPPSGSIEARVYGVLVGTGVLDHGSARVSFSFAAAASATPAAIEIAYLPGQRWELAEQPVTLRLPIKAPRPWGRIATALAGIALLVWFVRGRMRSAASARRPPPETQAALAARRPGVVVGEGRARAEGWVGRVVDAHDGVPLQGIAVSIERPGFEDAAVLAQMSTDRTGSFSLPDVATRPGDVFVARGRLYTVTRAPVPQPGSLEVAVVLRRRAVLDRLAAWAKTRGGRYDQQPDATPGHVRRASRGDVQVIRWAEAVERAAYGPDPVDAHTQAAIDALAPPDARRTPPEDDAIGADHVDGPRSPSV